ncbi:MAG: asparagine synthase (glutamine-hydrolyzing) [Actinomycetes bacterium]
MCGIAGRVGVGVGFREPIQQMTDAIIHRGPDEEGFFIAPGIELGCRRLAIIDVKGGQQPITIEGREITVILNGEIYNFQELRRFVMQRNFNLKTNGDTEVLAYLYLLEGLEFVHRLRGMFAIAIWDNRSKTLVLVRDRLGKKPLLYRRKSDGGLDFASEAKALLRAGAPREPDLNALDFVLTFGYAPPPMTGFKSIEALSPGNTLTWSDGKIRISQYWKFNSSEKTIFDMDEAIQRTRETLEESVNLRLISERPIGVLLSGGIDSSLVAAFAAKNLPTRLNTFSIGFEDPKYDESNFAKQVAQRLGTNHHELIVKPDPELLVNTLATTLDRPFADSSILPTFLVSEFARTEVVVALGGDGGDEGFGGYLRYQMVDWLQALNPMLRITTPLIPALERISFKTGNRRASRLAGALRSYPSKKARYMALSSLMNSEELNKLHKHNSYSQNESAATTWFNRVWENTKSREALDRPLAFDIETYLPEDLNFKTDIASMANSLELRSPFQDHKLIELSGQISEKLKFHNNETKYILRQIAKEFIPESIVDRKKMGFGIPRAAWMRNELKPLVKETLTGSAARNRGWFDISEVTRQIDLHNTGLDRDRILWPLFAIELWAQNWLD